MTATNRLSVSHPTNVNFLGHKTRPYGARSSVALLLTLLLSLVPAQSALSSGAVAQTSGNDNAGFISVALPQSGELLIENHRGSVRIEIWTEAYVALAANTQAPKSAARKLPVAIERGENILAIKIERATQAKSPRVDLILRVPSSARLKVSTTDGELVVVGLPAALSAQTVSGKLQLSLPAVPDASITAQSLNGAVTLAEGLGGDSGAGGRTLKGKFQARWGSGGSSVNLFSGRGLITLTTLSDAIGSGDDMLTRVEARQPRVNEPLNEAPKYAAPRMQPTETPQEVDEDEVVRVESDLVTLNVSVVDRASGRGLAGLAAGDFKIYEDNAEQRVEHFESADAPFDLLLLLDLSGSTTRVTDTIRAAARRFVAATRPQDRIAIITFAGETQIAAELTSDRASLRASIDRIAKPTGDTRLYDSLDSALDYMTRRSDASRRRAVILMTDGLDSVLPNVTGTGSTTTYDDVRSRVQEFEGIVYAIWTNTEYYEAFSPDDIQPETFDLAHDRMEEFAAAGGGAFYEVEKLEDLAGAYERVVADLGTVYTLSYRPINKQRDGRWRAIHIRLPRLADAVARGKRGYFSK